MQTILSDKSRCGFEWLDVTNPDPEELSQIAMRYGLHETAVEDCLEPDHLPKFEAMGAVNFAITRIYNPKKDRQAGTIQDLSSKIAIFYAGHFLITVHRLPQPLLKQIHDDYIAADMCPTTADLALNIIHDVISSYVDPGLALTDELEEHEDVIFLQDKAPDVLRRLYYLKRKASSAKRILLLSKDLITLIGRGGMATPALVQDALDRQIKAVTLYDQLEDDITHLLEIYISLQSQRADEVMRVLTVFSAFFLPLTFIVGVYGMNFQHMPELAWHYGYPASLGLMGLVVIVIYVWFKRRGWL